MKELLLRLKQDKIIASFFMKGEKTDQVKVGYVIDFNEDHYSLLLINRYGEFGGYFLNEIEDILCIDYDGIYEKKFKALHEYRRLKLQYPEFRDENLLLEFLKFMQANKLVAAIELQKSGFTDIQGFIEEVDDSKCVVKVITDYGREDGEAVCLLSDITEITTDSKEESTIKIMNEIGF